MRCNPGLHLTKLESCKTGGLVAGPLAGEGRSNWSKEHVGRGRRGSGIPRGFRDKKAPESMRLVE
jgi:hypothetical protein